MAVPKKKKSRARRDRRRAHHDVVATPAITSCTQCGAPIMPHTACSECGMYRGRQVIEIKEEEEAESE